MAQFDIKCSKASHQAEEILKYSERLENYIERANRIRNTLNNYEASLSQSADLNTTLAEMAMEKNSLDSVGNTLITIVALYQKTENGLLKTSNSSQTTNTKSNSSYTAIPLSADKAAASDIQWAKQAPPEESGYVAPKKGPQWDKEKKGWVDKNGNVWVPDKSGHGGEHWDVQYPNGGYDNVYPDGKVRSGKGKRGQFSPSTDESTSDTSPDYSTLAKVGLVITGGGIIVGTIIEDFVTMGAGVADDVPTISGGAGMIGAAFGF